ncbi:hypothetical protein P8452_51407 [Trifolium repens]|nr:hypothetical protein P8452_51407 [Trifolium repens]
MDKHDEASSSGSHDLDKWKMSLHQVANLSGFHYKKGDEQESPAEPGKRSRLWLPDDIVHVLEGNTGTRSILFKNTIQSLLSSSYSDVNKR